MTRLIVLCFLLGVAFCLRANGQDEPIEKKLSAAIERYHDLKLKADANLQGMLGSSIASAQRSGDLAKFQAIQAELIAFQKSRTLPKSVSTERYTSQVRRYQTILEAEYERAIKTYTRNGKIALASATQKQLTAFQRGELQPADAIEFNGKHYKVFTRPSTWSDAKAACERLGGHLAVVNNAAESKFIFELAGKAKLHEVWLGATDKDREGEWVWVTGQKMSFNAWAHNQPNNKGAGEHYLILVVDLPSHPKLKAKWCDQPNTAQALHHPGYVCQWD